MAVFLHIAGCSRNRLSDQPVSEAQLALVGGTTARIIADRVHRLGSA